VTGSISRPLATFCPWKFRGPASGGFQLEMKRVEAQASEPSATRTDESERDLVTHRGRLLAQVKVASSHVTTGL
jgi:hypothetical protein